MKSLRLIIGNIRYFAPAAVFASVNVLIGTWILYLPHIKTKFGIDDAQVGFALFFTACGLLFSIPFVPYVNKKIGTGRSTMIGITALALLFNLPLLATSYATLCLTLLFTGVFSGFTGTSMNALVSIIERRDGQYFMSAAHGFFSLGGFLGAGLGSFLILWFSIPVYHMLLVSACIVVITLLLAKNYIHIVEPPQEISIEKPSIFKYFKPMWGLSIIAFIIMFNEGAVEHWSNIFLYDIVHLSENQSGYGFVLFSLTMTLGRFLGDGLSIKLGAINTISYGCIIAVVAYLLILTTNVYLSVLGFGVLGLGISVLIPELFRLAGKTKNMNTSIAISVVSGIGFMGFLVGPVLLGFISIASNLVMSYVFLLMIVVAAFFIITFHLRAKFKNEILNQPPN